MDVQTAIRKMTSLPAEKFKIKESGKIAEGWFADIAVIDLNRVASHATFEDPCRYSDGIRHLLVNGVVAIEDSQPMGQRAGRPLRRT
jgi:N-acyl-D-amino-acid deacylase